MRLSIAPADPDLMRAARALIDLYGAEAASVAERRAGNLPGNVPESAASRWRRIGNVVRSLEASQPARQGDTLWTPRTDPFQPSL
jgi:hypothetical protein